MAANKTADVRYAPEDPSLPKPWRGLIDVKTNYIYFWNPQTNVTQYQKPDPSIIKPDSPDKPVSVAICSPVQVEQSSQVSNQEITTIEDDNDRNSRGSECRPEVDSGERNDQVVAGWMFREGIAVEVCFQEENFDVWHIGTVMKATLNNNCLVKYQCPGDVNKHKIQEFANSPDIRPSPPSLEDNDYLLLEKVEAFFECCWWSGIIRRLLEDRRYIVHINHAKKEMTFDHSDLRPCMVWTDGKWINEAKYNKRPGMLARQSESLNRQQRRAEEEQAGYACVSAEEDSTGVHVKEIVDKECLAKEVDTSLKEVKGARSASNCDTSQKKDQDKQSRDQEIHTVDSIKGSTEGNNSSKRRRGRPKMLSKKQIGERSTGAKMDMKDSCVRDEANLSAENDCVMSTTADEVPNDGDVHASSKENMAVNTSKRKLRCGVRRHNAVISRTANIPRLDDQTGETVPSKRANRLKNSMSNGHGETSRTVDSESRYKECHEIDNAKDDNMVIDEVGDINDDQPLSMWLNVLPPVGQDDSRALPVQDQCANNAKGRHDGFETPPLAKVDTIKPSRLQITDGPNPGDLPIENLNGCAESNDKGCELGKLAILSADTMENESLPFAKCSPLWKIIDSMEIYKKTKKPHFSPLVECIEETREGLAIGIMVNFFNLVEKISKLQFSSDIAIIERSLETLPEFESHGFDVEKVRACLTQLLSNKQRAKELQKEYDDIGSEISKGFGEDKLDEEINQLYQKFREIEKKLGEAKLKKEIRENTISALQSKQGVVKETFQSLQVEFKNIVGSLDK